MHAVSRDEEGLSKPCVYIQIDEGSEIMADDDEDDEPEDGEAPLTAELRLVPADEAQGMLWHSGCDQTAESLSLNRNARAYVFWSALRIEAGMRQLLLVTQ